MPTALNKMRLGLTEAGSEKETIVRLIHWAEWYLRFSDADHPETLERSSVESFLAELISEQFIDRAGQDQALEAICILFSINCGEVPGWLNDFLEERRKSSAQNTLSYVEVRHLLERMYGDDWLAAGLIYGSGLRVLECFRLRVRDLDFKTNQIAVRASDDRIERWTPLPVNLVAKLNKQLEEMQQQHIQAIVHGQGRVTLPGDMARTQPRRARSWDWQYLFPQPLDEDEARARQNRPTHHSEPTAFRRALEHAAIEARIYRQISGATLRNSFAAHMALRGVSKEHIQQMLGLRKMPGRHGKPEPLAIKGLHVPDKPLPVDKITYL
ncbi:MAG: tyrosine-type recombinase/integrase [Pseudomonadota bacterium]